MVRIYDFIGIGNTNGKKKIAVQCLYHGTVHRPQKICLSDFSRCDKYEQLKQCGYMMKK